MRTDEWKSIYLWFSAVIFGFVLNADFFYYIEEKHRVLKERLKEIIKYENLNAKEVEDIISKLEGLPSEELLNDDREEIDQARKIVEKTKFIQRIIIIISIKNLLL